MSTVLYDYWRSTASYRVRIALNIAAIRYETRPVDLLTGEHIGAAHLARNPQGFVPVLDIDGLRLTQSLAIVEYLDETRKLGLLPDDPTGRARVRALAAVLAADTHPVCNPSVVSFAVNRPETADPDAARIAWMRHFIARGLSAFEQLLDDPATGMFCHGDAPTLADLCLVPQLYNARRWGVDLQAFGRVLEVVTTAEAVPAFRNAAPDAVQSTL